MNIETLSCEYAMPAQPNGKLVVVLHGRGDSSAGFHWMPGAMGLAGVAWLLVNAPDPWYGGRSWYDLPPDHGPGVERSRLLLDQLFVELVENGYPPETIVLFGFSQGCLLTLEWGGRSDLPLAGCVGVSGYCYDADALSREVSEVAKQRPWLVTHGTQDEVLPHDVTAEQITILQAAGLPIDFRTYAKTHTIDPDLADIRSAMVQMLSLGSE
jgi:phospholipase/carboxylesterase